MEYLNKSQFYLADETASSEFAQSFADVLLGVWLENQHTDAFIVYLNGDLGAGKSFLSRAFIQSFLPTQKVKSPTYTLVESYQAPQFLIQHFDLYRLCDPEELEFLAIRELLAGQVIALVEWPEKGAGVMPSADLMIDLNRLPCDETKGRNCEIFALTDLASQVVEKLTEKLGT